MVTHPTTASGRSSAAGQGPTGLLRQRVETSNISFNGPGASCVADSDAFTRSVATLKKLSEIAAPDGTPLWFSRATPGRTHDLTAARAHGIVQACLTREILVLADRAYQGAGATVRTPYYGHRELPEKYQQYNRDHARLRAPGERAFARLKSWRLLRRARCSTNRISRTVAAVHTLLTCQYSG